MEELTHAQRMDSNRLIEEYFDSLMIRYRYIDSDLADTTFNFLGESFKTPILGGGFGQHQRIHPSGSLGYANAIHAAGSLNFNGWIKDNEIEAIAAAGIKTIRGIKPFRDHDKVYRAIEHDEACGAFAVCMDIDHIFERNGKYICQPSGDCGPQTVENLKGYVRSTKMPFILKGILSPEDAEKCVEIGVSAIFMTNHNNRLPCTVPPLCALPEVKKVVNGRFPILVDGCIESGVEAFKALALGADGILACRVLMKEFPKGPEAVTEKLRSMTAELSGCMANTGARDIAHISPNCVCRKGW